MGKVSDDETREPLHILHLRALPFEVVRVTDGDTIRLTLTLDVRVIGIDCPEMPTLAGKMAREATIEWLREFDKSKRVTLVDVDKYGRPLGKFDRRGGDGLAATLLTKGLARIWKGYRSERE